MYVLIVMLVIFFIVALSSWWLDDFGQAEDEPTPASTNLPIAVSHGQPSTRPIQTSAGD